MVLQDTAAGAVGAVCCVYAGLPFDLVKVRIQTASASRSCIESSSSHIRPIECFRQTIRYEGVRSLWKGALPALASSGIENAVLFAANGALKRLYCNSAFNSNSGELNVWTQACLGGAAGVFSATVFRCLHNEGLY